MKENKLTDRKGGLCPAFSPSVVHAGKNIDIQKMIVHISYFFPIELEKILNNKVIKIYFS